MTSAATTVSCVIVAFHRPDLLGALVSSIRHPQIELVVVNVEADPEIAAIAGTAVVDVADNVGFAAAVNVGARHATADVLVFMNDDMQATHHDVLRLAESLSRSDTCVTVPMVLRPGGDVEPTVRRLPGAWAYATDPLFQRRWSPPRSAQQIKAAGAAMVAVPTQLLRNEPMPEDYFLYFEEIEWFWRLHERHVTVTYEPEVRVVHLGGYAEVRPDKTRLLATNAVRCVRRTRGRSAAARAWPVVVAWNVVLLFVAIVTPTRRAELRARRAGVSAALRAWREI